MATSSPSPRDLVPRIDINRVFEVAVLMNSRPSEGAAGAKWRWVALAHTDTSVHEHLHTRPACHARVHGAIL